MELLLLLFNVIFITASSPDVKFNGNLVNYLYHANLRLPNDTVPKHYKIQLKVDIEKSLFHGISNVSIRIYKQTNMISFNAVGLDIIQPTIKNIYIPREKSEIALFQVMENEVITLYFKHTLSPGYYSLNMEFTGIISDMNDTFMGGFFKTPIINEKGDREWFVATHNWATGIRRTFPCWDEPGLRAEFTIIVQHPRKYKALSNMPRYMADKYVTEDVVETYFLDTPAIPAYFIVIVLYNLPDTVVFENINLRGRQQFVHDLIFASRVIANCTRYFDDEWKQFMRPKPEKRLINQLFPMQQHFAIPGLINDGMATWGVILYRDEDIIYNEKVDNIARKMEIACFIGRQIGRQSLNTVTSPSWWSYFWLNEGIATVLFARDIIYRIIPGYLLSDLFSMQILQESLYLDNQGIMNPLISDEFKIKSDKNSVFSFSYYIKAPAILRMLQHILGDEVFQKGINLYLKKQSATPNDFWAAIQYAHDLFANQDKTLKLNITKIINPWIKQNHYPVLFVSQEYYSSRNFFIMKILENSSETWSIYTTFTTPSNMNFQNFSSTKINSRETHALYESKLQNDWIILNLQQTGYYRVKYDTEIWQRIARYLNSKNYTNIHILNRAQIIDDAFYFTITGQLNASIFWEITRYLSRETEYIPWYPMIKAIERISYIFAFPNKSEHIKTIILERLEPLLREIGYDEDPNGNYLTICLRQEAVKWACVLNHFYCTKIAFNKLQWHLKNPTPHKLLPGWKKWTYCNGLSIADMTVLRRVYDIYFYETLFQKNQEGLEILACSKNFYINSTIIESQNYNKYFFKEIRENVRDRINFFQYNVAKHAKCNLVLDQILDNWESVIPREINMTTALIDIINHVYSKEQLNKIMKFVRNIKIELLTELTTCSDHQYINSKGRRLFNKSCEFITINKTKIIVDTKNKIDIRLSQIENQINTFDSVFGNSLAEK